MVGKRALRNSTTCPFVNNPLQIKQASSIYEHLLPSAVKDPIIQLPTLSCSHITNIPTLPFPNNIDQALKAVMAVAQWQTQQFDQSLKRQQKEENYRMEHELYQPHDQSLLFSPLRQNFQNLSLQQSGNIRFEHPLEP